LPAKNVHNQNWAHINAATPAFIIVAVLQTHTIFDYIPLPVTLQSFHAKMDNRRAYWVWSGAAPPKE
jgi:hypothetical protein